MNRYIKCFLLCTCMLSVSFATVLFETVSETTSRKTVSKWTIMIYVQSDSILNNFAIRNFKAMSLVGSNDDLNIIVQWNQPRRQGVWRYKIEKNQMRLLYKDPERKILNFADDLIDFSRFTVEQFPAENYVFILWNHGIGILDPAWNKLHKFAVNPTALAHSQRIQIDGITKFFPKDKRGILFDPRQKNYLNNDGLTHALSHITSNIIGKKFAVIGMDACLMSMIEVFYQIRNFADYAVASEEVELAQGWNYSPFLQALASTNTTNEKELAQSIVHTFEDFYKEKTKFYTQSAIDLEGIEFLKKSVDAVAANYELCKQIRPSCMTHALQQARNLCFQLSVPCYIDLYSFCYELHKQLDAITREALHHDLIHAPAFHDLKESLILTNNVIQDIVIANVSSMYFSRARGISIYFPEDTIDPSYLKTQFAQESMWLSFLQASLKK